MSLSSAFRSSLENNTTDQLSGMVDSARIPMTRLSDPMMYYIASGNEIDLRLNSKEEPLVLVLGNNALRKEMYGSFLGLYFSTITRLINQPPARRPTALFLDEIDTVYINNIGGLITTARSNLISIWMGLQGKEQLEKSYGQKLGESIYSIVGNIFCGQVLFSTAEMMSKLFGRTMQQKVSQTQNSDDISTTTSTNMEQVIPASKLVQLSQGDMAGVVADNFGEVNKYKMFRGTIVHDNKKIANDKKSFQPLPKTRNVTDDDIMENYFKIKYEVSLIVDEATEEMERAAEGVGN